MSILELGNQMGCPEGTNWSDSVFLLAGLATLGSTYTGLVEFCKICWWQAVNMCIDSPSPSLYPRRPLGGQPYHGPHDRLDKPRQILTHLCDWIAVLRMVFGPQELVAMKGFEGQRRSFRRMWSC